MRELFDVSGKNTPSISNLAHHGMKMDVKSRIGYRALYKTMIFPYPKLSATNNKSPDTDVCICLIPTPQHACTHALTTPFLNNATNKQ